jgi:hypothetical protein
MSEKYTRVDDKTSVGPIETVFSGGDLLLTQNATRPESDDAIARRLAKNFNRSHDLDEIGKAIVEREKLGEGKTAALLSALRDALSQYDYSLNTESANGDIRGLEVDKFNQSKQQWEYVAAKPLPSPKRQNPHAIL